MVWQIGDGNSVRIGLDPWIGCKWRHSLPPSMIEKLHLAGFFVLSDIGLHGLTDLLAQQRTNADFIGFTDPQEIDLWNAYLTILKSSYARLSSEDDTLVWNLSKSGKYRPKEGYAQLMHRELDNIWWWKIVWKLKCPLKAKIFSWFILSSKALTWDVLILKGREGPGRCYLCKQDCESNFHIGVECPFTQSVWLLIADTLKLNNL